LILTPDNEYAAVLDACVLAPMPLCDTLLRCAEEPALYRVLWSEETVREVHRTIQKFGYSESQADRRIAALQQAFPAACQRPPADLIDALHAFPDPNDRHVAAAAIHAGAHVVVTANLKHFPQELLAPHNLLAQSPQDFLIHQYHLNPERVYEVLDTQANAIGKGREELLQKLQQGLPDFATLIRQNTHL
jgi:predicted nucleic acid-binding protein